MDGELQGTMVRFEAGRNGEPVWTEPDHFEIKANDVQSNPVLRR
jgi:hypothetical protein